MPPPPALPDPAPLRGRGLQLAGLALFLFIPLVLYLFVVHPEPVGASLGAGVALMLGHRLLARPYRERARRAKCLWCNRLLPALPKGIPHEPRSRDEWVTVHEAGTPVAFRVCPGHAEPSRRLLAWLERAARPLAAGIFLPLLALLLALSAAAFGERSRLPAATALFQLLIGVTVQAAAIGPRLGAPRDGARAVFPLHNFTLLGLRNLLWIFRLVGAWWIVRGATYFLRGPGSA